MASASDVQKTVTLVDWWLTKPQPETIGVAGHTSHQGSAVRLFTSAPILKIYNLFQLETVDGVCVMLQAFINKDQTLENGFLPEVFDHFLIGFPHNWKEFSKSSPQSDSAAEECVTPVQEDVSEGHVPGDFHGNPQNDDSYTLHKGVKDCKDLIIWSDKTTTTPLNPPSVEIQEHIIEAGNEVLCEKSPVTPGFEDDLNPPSIEVPQEHIIEAENEILCEKSPVTQLRACTDMKSRRNKKKNRVNIPQKALMTRSKSKTKVVAKSKPITSPKSTFSRGKKGLEGSPNIVPLESVSAKKTRSGRVVLPPLEFWRNQQIVYDEDRQMCGVQEPK